MDTSYLKAPRGGRLRREFVELSGDSAAALAGGAVQQSHTAKNRSLAPLLSLERKPVACWPIFVLPLVLGGFLVNTGIASSLKPGQSEALAENWQLQSLFVVKEPGATVSSSDYKPERWYPVSVPTTALGALVKHGVYPDPRIGMNAYLIPDASEEFNTAHDLGKFSHLPNQRNPWKDPYWFRTTFDLPALGVDEHAWLVFKGINYRAEVWVNGRRIADRGQMVGMYRQFRFDITACAVRGRNALAVKVFPVDHPGTPDTQWVPFGPYRNYATKELLKDVTFTMAIGYDCMPTIPDRAMGIWQEVLLELTGPVEIRNPFVVTDLPLPKTDPACLTVTADVANLTDAAQVGVLQGEIGKGEVEFEQRVELGPRETRLVRFTPAAFPQLAISKPRLWWPRNYGPQNLHSLRLAFVTPKGTSDEKQITFGIRKITKELHALGGQHGLRVCVNGQKVFCQGGWLQPELLLDMPARRMETEVRYLVEANQNTVTFEDLPVPSDAFLDACDRLGLMFWCSYYGSYWVDGGLPEDHGTLAQGAADVIRRCRNHPSLVLHSCVGEGRPSEDIYRIWRKAVLDLDPTRLFIPTIDVRTPAAWLNQDLPTGLHDAIAFGWMEPAGYYEAVRGGGKWMFNTEVCVASFPPVATVARFIPDLFRESEPSAHPWPVTRTWAQHDFCNWHKGFDAGLRRAFGEPQNVEDYIFKGQVASAMLHRAWSEAVNHRMWDITSGVWQWKLNSCWPSVGWQIYDWYLNPMATYYYNKLAFEPLHVQLSPLDSKVTLVNRRLEPARGLHLRVRVYDQQMKLRWEKRAAAEVQANTYKEIFAIPKLDDLTAVYFVKLELDDSDGKPVSQGLYWLSTKAPADFTDLSKLPLVALDLSQESEIQGDDLHVCVRVKNPTDRLAFFIHLAATRGPRGEPVAPIFWEDNYFSLLPGESREVRATFSRKDVDGAPLAVEAGGWNIRTPYQCQGVAPSKPTARPGESLTVTASVANTFSDGSWIELHLDGQTVQRRLIYAKAKAARDVVFPLTLSTKGEHSIRVGNQACTVRVTDAR